MYTCFVGSKSSKRNKKKKGTESKVPDETTGGQENELKKIVPINEGAKASPAEKQEPNYFESMAPEHTRTLSLIDLKDDDDDDDIPSFEISNKNGGWRRRRRFSRR
jgi:hypothetical protein